MKDCCEDKRNRVASPEDEREDLKVERCSVCGCRHFELTVDPGKLGIIGTSL